MKYARETLAVNMLTLALVGACLPPVPPVVVDPVGPPGDCVAACANLERLQCPGWDGSPGPDDQMGTADDVPCTPTCESIQVEDPTFGAYLGCQARADTCTNADRCFETAR